MTILKWDGTATAQSSIVHGAQALGTVTYLRRERFILPNGQMEEIPVVSGNALRGVLRDVAADLWWEAVGRPKLTLPVMHALWSGGALAKATGAPMQGSRLQALKHACPVVGVFGTAGGGRIIDGNLQVGKLIPVCQETSHLLPQELAAQAQMRPMWDLTQLEWYSRLPNRSMADQGVVDEDDLDMETSRLARYGVESFVAGTRFHTWMSLSWATPVEAAFFAEVIDTFSKQARVGGLGRAGHGQLLLDLASPASLATVTAGVDWRAQVAQTSTDELLMLLAGLD